MRDLPKLAFDESTKEPFAHIGRTLLSAQSFESSLSSALIGLHIVENKADWHEKYEEVSGEISALTLGRLLKRLRIKFPFSDDVDKLFRDAHRERDRFVHHFYEEYFALLQNRAGHEKLIEHLNALHVLFRRADATIAPMSHALLLEAGMTEAQMVVHAENALRDQLHEKGVTI